MSNINSLSDASEALEALGYAVNLTDNAVQVAVGGSERPFAAVLTLAGDSLNITCQLAKLGDLKEDNIAEAQFMMLDANSRINPYAFAVLTSSDNPDLNDAADFPIVLVDSLPIGDLSTDELSSSMTSLLMAIDEGSAALRVAL